MFNRLYYLLFIFILAGCFSVTIKTDGGIERKGTNSLPTKVIKDPIVKASVHKINKDSAEILRLQHKVNKELQQIHKLQEHKEQVE